MSILGLIGCVVFGTVLGCVFLRRNKDSKVEFGGHAFLFGLISAPALAYCVASRAGYETVLGGTARDPVTATIVTKSFSAAQRWEMLQDNVPMVMLMIVLGVALIAILARLGTLHRYSESDQSLYDFRFRATLALFIVFFLLDGSIQD